MKVVIRRRLRQRAGALALAVFTMFGSMGAAAAPRVPEDMDQATYDRLQDNVVEWDELGNLVEYYSPMFADMKAITKEQTLSGLEDTRNAWQNQADEEERKKNNLKDDLDKATDPLQVYQLTVEYMTAKATEQAYRQARAGYSKAAKTAGKKIDQSFAAQKPQLVNGMEQAFVGAKTLEQALQINQKQVELYQAAYNTQQLSAQNGLATQADVLGAQYSLENAKNQLAKTEESYNSVKRSLGLMLGWNADTAEDIRFGALPDYDLNYLDGRDFEADFEQAKTANKNLGTIRREQAFSSSARNAKERELGDAEQTLRLELTTLWQTIKEKRLSYDAAQSGLEAARLSRDAAERKKALGMVGNAEYEGLKMQYIAQEAQANMAQMEYFSAVFNYEWALQGIMPAAQ